MYVYTYTYIYIYVHAYGYAYAYAYANLGPNIYWQKNALTKTAEKARDWKDASVKPLFDRKNLQFGTHKVYDILWGHSPTKGTDCRMPCHLIQEAFAKCSR